MTQISWDENKIKELNLWIKDESTSSYGAVLLELQSVLKTIEHGGVVLVTIKGVQKRIQDKQALRNFISENLSDANYFLNKIG